VVEVKEIDSILEISSGDEIAVLGGLMESRNTIENTKIPVAGDIPFLGNLLFTAQSEVKEVVELVIIMKATILERGKPLDVADQRLVDKYTNDPRPLV